jgi:hypothetical protein
MQPCPTRHPTSTQRWRRCSIGASQSSPALAGHEPGVANFDDPPAEAAFRAKARAWLQANAPRELLPTLEKVAYGDAILETPVVIHASKL